ncbi:MAG: hypothetical protein Q8O67_06270 [Deltaproteobacteria bacterium]|nr:hypothetical protein [Deltaproteobacteria bacterium]
MLRRLTVVVVVVVVTFLSACPYNDSFEGADAQCDDFDEDGDGFPRPNTLFLCCDEEFTCAVDCNDDDDDIHPSGFSPENQVDDPPGDGLDTNCDGLDGVVGVDDQ